MTNTLRKIILLLTASFISFSVFAQEEESTKDRGRLSLTFTPFNDPFIIQTQTLECGTSYEINSYTLGFSHIRPIKKWLDLEYGLEFSPFTIIQEAKTSPDPNMADILEEEYSGVYLINAPVSARVNILKYFYLIGGVMISYELGDNKYFNNQTGIGALLGLGAQFELKNGVGLFVDHTLKTHSLIPFKVDDKENRERVFEIGFRAGFTYRF